MTCDDLRAHDDLQARIWADRRLPGGTRELALAMAWVLHRDKEHAKGRELWATLREMLGTTGPVHPRWRLWELMAADAPRYVPERPYGYGGTCEGPRMRAYQPRERPPECLVSAHHPHTGECRYTQVHVAAGWSQPSQRDSRVCGAHGTICVTETDMVTGWVTDRWFCSRHQDRASDVRAMLAARGTPPEPVPNTGGLLPRYFGAQWERLYARACEESLSMHYWKPPYHGCDADNWPVPGQQAIPRRPRLSLIVPV